MTYSTEKPKQKNTDSGKAFEGSAALTKPLTCTLNFKTNRTWPYYNHSNPTKLLKLNSSDLKLVMSQFLNFPIPLKFTDTSIRNIDC